MITAVKSSSNSRSRDAADHLEEQLRDVAPNERIGTKTELQKKLGVAAGTLNEALRLLQERGLIEVKPGPRGGVFTTTPDPVVRLGQTFLSVRGRPESVDHAVAVRNALEPLTVMEALHHRKAASVRALRSRIEKIAESIADDEQFLRQIWYLHEEIAEMGSNQILTSMYLGILKLVEDATLGVVPQSKSIAYKRERLRVHEMLVDAIDRKDVEAAERALEAHTLATS
ncbi:FadR/GntR family transcriptional regulator [Nocardioides mesophilus]|uniref:FadR family transcriptional regulator n=1 Tax=Nocardioides mesophilus TaxID=433659 RepID=A0A7G9RFM0_9ACTN|nr:FCD domain-containing protein [Nocardioides mesophilus]QNN54395.1 FadR family transcriptional regulator [Nocardioides mesophilus]